MKAEELRDQFHNEQGIKWENSQGEPDIEYVQWLEQKVIRREIYAKSVAVEFELHIGPVEYKDSQKRKKLVELWFDTWIKNSQ